MASSKETLLSLTEACAYWGYTSDQYARKQLRNGKIRGEKDDFGRWRISIEEAKRWKNRPITHSSRSDGKLKYIIYLTKAEAAELGKTYELKKAPTHASRKKAKIAAAMKAAAEKVAEAQKKQS